MYHVGCKKDFFVEVLIFLSLALYKHPAAIVVPRALACFPFACLIFRRNLQVIHLSPRSSRWRIMKDGGDTFN